MLSDYIERARKQPEDVRRRLVWVWSFTLTGIIVLVWLSVIIGRQYAATGGNARPQNNADTGASPVRSTAEQFEQANQFINGTMQTFTDSMKTVTSSTSAGIVSSSSVSSSGPSSRSKPQPGSSTPPATNASPTPVLWP